MYKKNYKGKCYKRALRKCEETYRTYSEIADVYAQRLEESSEVAEIRCNVLLDGFELGEYTSDFVCRRTNRDLMVRECVMRHLLVKPMTMKLEEQGLIRRTEKKQLTGNILHENPLMSYKEFYEKTGLSKATYDVYKRELGNSKDKHFELQREYFLQPFCINPNISCAEYVKQCNCSSSTYRKYRKIYWDSNK